MNQGRSLHTGINSDIIPPHSILRTLSLSHHSNNNSTIGDKRHGILSPSLFPWHERSSQERRMNEFSPHIFNSIQNHASSVPPPSPHRLLRFVWFNNHYQSAWTRLAIYHSLPAEKRPRPHDPPTVLLYIVLYLASILPFGVPFLLSTYLSFFAF